MDNLAIRLKGETHLDTYTRLVETTLPLPKQRNLFKQQAKFVENQLATEDDLIEILLR